MANGRVCTGFSKPYVAAYAEAATPHYTNGIPLARGVDVNATYTTADKNTFAADNVSAESAGGNFESGELSLTVDGVFLAVRRVLWDIAAKRADGFTPYKKTIKGKPVGVGFVARYMSDGVESFVPYVYTHTKFALSDLAAATSEDDNITWTTESLTAQILVDYNGDYLLEGEAVETEAAAEQAIKTLFAISDSD